MPALDYAAIADLYDSFVRFEGDLAFFVEAARSHTGSDGGAVLELMAGTGRVSLPLLEAGIDTTCVELAPAMLAILTERARKRGLAPKPCCADVGHLPFEEAFDRVFLPFQGFGELVDETEQRRALASIHRALRDGGRFVLTLHNPPVRLESVTGEWESYGRSSRPGGAGEVELRLKTRWDRRRHRVTGFEQLRLYTAGGELEEERTLPLTFSLVSRARFEAMSSECGFHAVSLHGDFEGGAFNEGSSPVMVWVLQKGS